MTTRAVPADFGYNQEQRGSFELFLLVLQVRKWLSTQNLQRDFLFSQFRNPGGLFRYPYMLSWQNSQLYIFPQHFKLLKKLKRSCFKDSQKKNFIITC